jgi:hypothetical protein
LRQRCTVVLLNVTDSVKSLQKGACCTWSPVRALNIFFAAIFSKAVVFKKNVS